MRMRLVMATVTLGVVGAVGLAGCAIGNRPDRATRGGSAAEQGGLDQVEVAEDLPVEGQALVAMGFAAADIATPLAAPAPAPTPSARPGRDPSLNPRRRHPARVFLRRNTLHGEVVVQGRDGVTRTVVVQRGAVTAIDATTITVKSSDGFTLTWTLGSPLHVIEHRTSIKATDIAVGAQVGIAGAKDGDKTVARLIVIPRRT